MAQSSSFDKDTLQTLRSLKQQLKTRAPSPSQPSVAQTKPARSVTPDSQKIEDDQLFQQAMHGVTPLKQAQNLAPAQTKPKKPTAQILAKRAAAMGTDENSVDGISDTQAMLNPVASEAFLSYRLATLQHRVFEQLKSGKLRWYEAVDLHGCTIEQARAAVLQILDMARQANENVVKIVHGKGPQAILKTYVNGWLRQHRDVLAFVSAPPEQGGTGAVLVLIKRAERQNSSEQPDKKQSKAR